MVAIECPRGHGLNGASRARRGLCKGDLLMSPYVDTAVSTLVGFLPSLIAAVLLLIVGYIIARVVSGLVKGLLRRTSLDNRLARSLGGPGLGSEGAIASVV